MSDRFVIVAAIDLNQGSGLVVEEALATALRRGNAEVHVLSVREMQIPAALYPVTMVPIYGTPTVEDTTKFCERLLAGRSPEGLPPAIHVHVTLGRPADEIVWFAAHIKADLIVVGTHGRRGLKRLLLGSVAEKVVRTAGCAVSVVREKSHDASERAPEIEPLCPECATKRFETRGAELWCARHSEHHIRAHVRHYDAIGEDPPHAWSSSTGT